MQRWRILFASLAVTLAVLLARYLLHEIIGIRPDLVWDDIQTVITGASLIIGLMIVGVVRDFVEAAQLPGVVAGGLSALDSVVRSANIARGTSDPAPHIEVRLLANTIHNWLYSRLSDADMRAAVERARTMLIDLQRGGPNDLWSFRAHEELTKVTGAVNRMMVLRNTSYLTSGYTLMDVLMGIVVLLLLIVEFPRNGLAPWLIAGSLTLVFVYLVILVRDLDNPFSYGGRGGGAEVDLTQLTSVIESLGRDEDLG
ncbi:MAG: hypothetical protein U0838_01740 [Chloroflexota bacterium]